MIDLNLPEPEHKECVYCLRKITNKTTGTLIHWPGLWAKDKSTVKILDGTECEPFSFWAYLCRWCRRKENSRKS